MRRKIFLIFLVFIMVISLTTKTNAQQETSLGTGFTDILFSNGYRGFCLDRDLKGAYPGEVYTSSNETSNARSNVDNRDVSQELKVLFTQHFEDLFVKTGDNEYVIDSLLKDSTIPSVVYHFTDGQYIWGDAKNLVNKIQAYSGPTIPDNGYKKVLSNGDVITFYFKVMLHDDEKKQDFFAYKFDVNKEPAHTHVYDDLKYDETSHWFDCQCGESSDKEEHFGGEATCKDKPVCDKCEQPYGSTDKDNHKGETELRDYKPATQDKPGYTGDTYCLDCEEIIIRGTEIPRLHVHSYTKVKFDEESHWYECECKDVTEKVPHSGGEPTCKDKAVCEECEQPYGEVNKNKHVGGIIIKLQVPTSYTAPGYTGDKHCGGCDDLLEKGSEIPQLHMHVFNKLKYDETSHWFDCQCGESSDKEEHYGGEATCKDKPVCDKCEHSYGSTDKDNHKGETELRDYKPATQDKPGYTGDTYCLDCEEIIIRGNEIPQLHVHSYTEVKFDEESHWYECECKETTEKESHFGGEANCKDKAICEECEQAYGEVNKNKHVGGIIIKQQVPASYTAPGYTGDKHCGGCDELLEKGTEIPQLHMHVFNKLKYDDDSHWFDCECGESSDKEEHFGGEPTCKDKPVCDKCEQPYGSTDKDNHKGETELRDYKPATQDKPGYTGDTYCLDCEEIIIRGNEIPQLHVHSYTEVKFDEESHWYECECKDVTEKVPHSGGEPTCKDKGICEECEQSYGELNRDIHVGGTVLKNESEPTCINPGYTGDKYCGGCDELLEKGTEIPKLHMHVFNELKYDETSHWFDCECRESSDKEEHFGEEATCIEKAECEFCEQPYGSTDKDNHKGETELRDYEPATQDKPGYTGDTYCKDCDRLIEKGKEIPQLHDGHDENPIVPTGDSNKIVYWCILLGLSSFVFSINIKNTKNKKTKYN